VRNRDTMEQERVKIPDLIHELQTRFGEEEECLTGSIGGCIIGIYGNRLDEKFREI